MFFSSKSNLFFFGIVLVSLLFGTFSAGKEPLMVALRDDPNFDAAFISPQVADSFSQTNSISIDTLISRVTQLHPSIRQAEYQTDALYGDWIDAGLKENPEISYVGAEIGGSSKAGRQGLGVSQVITSRKKRNARQAAAANEQRAAIEEKGLQFQKISNDAALAGYTLLIAQERVLVSEEILALTRKAAATTEAMVNAGEAPVTDLLADQVDLAKAESALTVARQEEITASNRIAVLLGESTDSRYSITDSIDDFPTELDTSQIWNQISESSPLIKKAYANYNAALTRLQQEIAEAGIDVTAEGAVLYNTWEEQTEVGVGISVPLRIHNRNQGKILRAEYEVRAAQSNIDRVKMQLREDFQEQLGRYETARAKILLYRESLLNKVERSYTMISESYRRGESSMTALLDAERTVQSVKMNYLSDLMEMITSQTLLNGFLVRSMEE